MLILIVGSPASGKTTLINECIGYKGFKSVKIGDLMLKYAKKSGYKGDRDGLRMLPADMQMKLQRHALLQLANLNGNYFIDTHISVEADGRYIHGLPNSSLGALKKVAGIIYVDAPIKDILSRRAADRARNREVEPASAIEIQKIVNLSALSNASWSLGVPFYILENGNGMLNRSVKRLKEIISELS